MTDNNTFQNENTLTQNDEKCKPKKEFEYKNIYKDKIGDVPITVREYEYDKAVEARPLWGEEEVVVLIPLNKINANPDFNAQQKTIIIQLLGSGPAFVAHIKHICTFLGTKEKPVSENTALKHLKPLIEKGYIEVHTILDSKGKFKRYTLKSLEGTSKIEGQKGGYLKNCAPENHEGGTSKIEGQKGGYLKNCALYKDLKVLTLYFPTAKAGWEPPTESFNFPKKQTEELTLAHSMLRSIARYSVQNTGKIINHYGPEFHSEPRRYSQMREIMKKGIFHEDDLKARQNAHRKLTTPKQFDPPAKKQKVIPTKNYKDLDWKSCKRTKSNVMAWLQHCPEIEPVTDRLVCMSNQDEWDVGSARSLMYRWQENKIHLNEIVLLEREVKRLSKKPNLCWLVRNYKQWLSEHSSQIQADAQQLAYKVRDFSKGEDMKCIHHIKNAKRRLEGDLNNAGVVTYNSVQRILEHTPHFAVIIALHELKLLELIHHYHEDRCPGFGCTQLEEELADNKYAWEMWMHGVKIDPQLFYYDKQIYEGLRRTKKIKLQRECWIYGYDMVDILQLI